MSYFEKVAAYEDVIMEKVAMSKEEHRVATVGANALMGTGIGGGAGALYGLIKKRQIKTGMKKVTNLADVI